MVSNEYGEITAIGGTSSTDVWAMGGCVDGTTPCARHWDGTQLTKTPFSATALGISMVTPQDGWAVGTGGAVIHWNGTAWGPYVPTIQRTYTPLVTR